MNVFYKNKATGYFVVLAATFLLGVAADRLFSPMSEKKESFPVTQLKENVSIAVKVIPQKERGRFQVAGVKSDSEVEEVWIAFQQAVAANDKEKVASLASYPFRASYFSDSLDRSSYHVLNNPRQFVKHYDEIFDQALKDFIAKTTSAVLWARYDGIATPRGVIWIGVFCKDSSCDTGYDIQIRTIHSDSVFIERKKK